MQAQDLVSPVHDVKLEILSAKEWQQKTEAFSTLSTQQQLQAFTPFEMGRHLRRNCEIDYYHLAGKTLLEADPRDIPLEEKAFFVQNLSFAFMQKGLHREADFYNKTVESWEGSAYLDSLPLFRARQAQIRGPLMRELFSDPDKGITLLQKGLRACKDIANLDQRYLAQVNLQRDLALCYLKKEDFEQALSQFNQCLESAKSAKFDLFCLPVLNYIALSTVRLAQKKQQENDLVAADKLFFVAVEKFAAVNQQYQDYEKQYTSHYQESVLQDCQDWASHVFHFGISCCDRGLYDEAIQQLLRAKEIRIALNLQGQLNNRVAEVCEWLAKAYLGKQDVANARSQAEEALAIYKNKLQSPDVAAIVRVNNMMSAVPKQEDKTSSVTTGLFRPESATSHSDPKIKDKTNESHVLAYRYQCTISEDVTDFAHGGHDSTEFFIPSAELFFNENAVAKGEKARNHIGLMEYAHSSPLTVVFLSDAVVKKVKSIYNARVNDLGAVSYPELKTDPEINRLFLNRDSMLHTQDGLRIYLTISALYHRMDSELYFEEAYRSFGNAALPPYIANIMWGRIQNQMLSKRLLEIIKKLNPAEKESLKSCLSYEMHAHGSSRDEEMPSEVLNPAIVGLVSGLVATKVSENPYTCIGLGVLTAGVTFFGNSVATRNSLRYQAEQRGQREQLFFDALGSDQQDPTLHYSRP